MDDSPATKTFCADPPVFEVNVGPDVRLSPPPDPSVKVSLSVIPDKVTLPVLATVIV